MWLKTLDGDAINLSMCKNIRVQSYYDKDGKFYLVKTNLENVERTLQTFRSAEVADDYLEKLIGKLNCTGQSKTKEANGAINSAVVPDLKLNFEEFFVLCIANAIKFAAEDCKVAPKDLAKKIFDTVREDI